MVTYLMSDLHIYIFNIPPISCNGLFLNMSPCAAALCPSRADQTQQSLLACAGLQVEFVHLSSLQNNKSSLLLFLLKVPSDQELPFTSALLQPEAATKSYFLSPFSGSTLASKGGVLVLPLIGLDHFSGWNCDRTATTLLHLDKLLQVINFLLKKFRLIQQPDHFVWLDTTLTAFLQTFLAFRKPQEPINCFRKRRYFRQTMKIKCGADRQIARSCQILCLFAQLAV